MAEFSGAYKGEGGRGGGIKGRALAVVLLSLPGNVGDDRLPMVEGGLEGATILRFHADHLAFGPQSLDGQGHACQEARPTHRDDHIVHLGRAGG